MRERSLIRRAILGTAILCAGWSVAVCAEPPAPTLDTLFPPGAAAGNTLTVEVTGKSLANLKSLMTSLPGFRCTVKDGTHCDITIPAETPPGVYDIWAECDHGLSSPRIFTISRGNELLESAGNDTPETALDVPLNSVINGRIEAAGDLDFYRFAAKQGQRVILDCRAERIDSNLRAVLEVFDADGQRLAANRGYGGVDPLIDFRAPADGNYVVKIHDLIYSGSAAHYYRLELDAGPRVAFTVPNVIQRGQPSRVKVFGWNLGSQTQSAVGELDQIDIEVPAEMAQDAWPLPLRLPPTQLGVQGFAYRHPDSNAPVFMGISDLPVQLDGIDNHAPNAAMALTIPREVCGQLAGIDEADWFAIDVARGEVLYFEVLAERLGSPIDPQLSVWDATGENLLAEWNDELENCGGTAFPTSHLDPAGRWVAPADGRYLLAVRNLRDPSKPDPWRVYRLSIRREVPDFHLVAIPKSATPTGFTVRRGGRLAFDIFAARQRGMQESIRVSARDLPIGLECPDIVLGPGEDRAILVISASPAAKPQVLPLRLEGRAKSAGVRPVRGSTVVREGSPNGWSRLISETPLSVSGESSARISAKLDHEVDHPLYGKLKLRYAPGSVLDLNVTLEQRDANHRPAARLMGIGLPSGISNQTANIPAGESQGVISFYLPANLSLGEYSLAVSAETTIPADNGKSESVTLISNPVTFFVEPAAFQVAVDPLTPRQVKRGETFQVEYSAARTNGFIGKIHTELASPGVVTIVPGLRGRGVTFTGQTERGSIQIVVNDSAPLGTVEFVRLFGVGVVEDEPTYFGAAMFPLEIVELP